jgi:hypothetical protein
MNFLQELLPGTLFGRTMPWASQSQPAVTSTNKEPSVPPSPIQEHGSTGSHTVPPPVPPIVPKAIDTKGGLEKNLGLLLVDQVQIHQAEAAASLEKAKKLKETLNCIYDLFKEIDEHSESNGSYTTTEKYRELVTKLQQGQDPIQISNKTGTLTKEDVSSIKTMLNHARGDITTTMQREAQVIAKSDERHHTLFQFISSCLHALRDAVRRILGGINR